jgi:hypothetical protein
MKQARHACPKVNAIRGAALPAPKTAITIAVDTAYVAAQQGQDISQGIYMMDNQLNNGSTGEGGLELSTVTTLGSLIGFDIVPLNPNSGDTVVIEGFQVEPPPGQTGVFGSSGFPQQQPPLGNQPDGSYWVGQAQNAGSQTYQILIKVTVGLIRPVSYFIRWDPFITAQ